MKRRLADLWPVALSAILLALAFPPANLSFLVFAALVPWLKNLRDRTPKYAFRSGYVFGVVYFSYQMAWVVMFVNKWVGNIWLALVPILITSFLAGWFYALVGWLINACYRRNAVWLAPIVWAGIEGFRAYVPMIAFPWGNVSLPLWAYPEFVQHAAFGTMFLVSAWVVLANVAITEALFPQTERDHRFVFRALYVFVGLSLAGATRMFAPAPSRQVAVTLGQPGVDLAFDPPEVENQKKDEAGPELALSAKADGSDLLVLPEGFGNETYSLPPPTTLGPEPIVPLVMGVHRLVPGRSAGFETAAFWDGKAWHSADKTRLVVFGEYIPFREFLPFLGAFNLTGADMIAATDLKTPLVNGVRYGPLVCFEGVFPDLAQRHSRQGAQVLVQMSIDDWYIDTPAYDQLWMSTVWRSIESGLPVARVGGLGKSLMTDNRGHVLTMLPDRVKRATTVKTALPESSDAFPYRMGFVWLAWIVSTIVGLTEIRDKLRSRPKPAAKAKTPSQ